MSFLKSLSLRKQFVRCLSDVVESNNGPSKFVVHKGRFTKVSEKSAAHEEITHTGQVF